MSIVAAPEVQYAHKKSMHDQYLYSLIFPSSGSQSVTLTANSSPDVVFEVPSKVLNFSKSYLSFKLEIPAVATRVQAMSCIGVPQIQRISLATRSGLYLCDLPHFQEYTASVLPLVTKQSDMEAHGSAKLGAIAPRVGAVLPLTKSRNSPTIAAANVKALTPADKEGQNVYSASGYIPSHATSQWEELSERNGAIAHLLVNGDPEEAMYTTHIVPLSAAAHSVLSIDRSMYYPEVLLLQVHFNPTSRYAKSYSAGGTINSTTAADIAQINMSELGLHLALSNDPVAMTALINGVLNGAGMNIPVPYVISSQNTYNQQYVSTSLRANVGYGARLLCAYTTMYTRAVNAHRYMCHNASNGDLYESLYTTLDSQRLQHSNMRSIDNGAYAENKHLLEGCAIQGSVEHAENFTYVDSWRAGKTADWLSMDTIEDGLELTNAERTYASFFDVGTAVVGDRTVFTHMVFQKQLTLTSQGISLV